MVRQGGGDDEEVLGATLDALCAFRDEVRKGARGLSQILPYTRTPNPYPHDESCTLNLTPKHNPKPYTLNPNPEP